MDRRLIQAYDKMTMPDSCSQRIEARLAEKTEPRKEQEYTMVLGQNTSPWAWLRAAALVCMAVAVTAGAAALFLKAQSQGGIQSAEIPVFSEPTVQATEPKLTEDDWRVDYFPYGEAGEDFLDKMCHVMPPWDGYASLDDVFWTEFIVRLLNDFEYIVASEQFGEVARRVQTPAGQALLTDGRVSMKREQLNAFVQEAMGCELAEFNPSGEYLNRISYENQTYYVELTEFPRLRYERQPSETKSDREVTYRIYREADQETAGELTFYLEDAENEWGFIILGRPTTFGLTEITEPDPQIETVAMAFGEAYFANDIEGLKAHLSCREDSSLILNPFVNQTYSNGEADPVEYEIVGMRLFASGQGEDYPVAFVDYITSLNPWYPEWSLVLEMVRTEDGWKVRGWDQKNRESYNPDREELYTTARYTAWQYLSGSKRNRYLASEQMDPPVYEGGAENPQIQKITIYFDPPGETNDLGELMADAYVEIWEPEEALNPIALYLHFVKRDGEWKIDNIGEG